jgi:hypothetical protein
MKINVKDYIAKELGDATWFLEDAIKVRLKGLHHVKGEHGVMTFSYGRELKSIVTALKHPSGLLLVRVKMIEWSDEHGDIERDTFYQLTPP